MKTSPQVPGEGGQVQLPPPSLGYTPPPAAPVPPPPPGAAPPPYPPAPPPPYPPPPYAYAYAQPAPVDGPAPGMRYAGFAIRTGAYLVDAAILFAACLVAGPALGGFTHDTTVVVLGNPVVTQTVNPAFALFAFLLQAIYFIGFWSTGGRTPGMMLTHLRILRAADGRPIGLGAAVVRFVGLLIGFWVVFLGVIWVALDPRRQGWHDKMAGTFVVQEVPAP